MDQGRETVCIDSVRRTVLVEVRGWAIEPRTSFRILRHVAVQSSEAEVQPRDGAATDG